MLSEKKRPPAKAPKAPAFAPAHASSWKVAYADFVTAMMAFFLLMWILNMVPPETQKQLETYFKVEKLPQQGALFNPDQKDAVRLTPLSKDEAMRYAIAVKLRKIITEDPFLKNSSGVSSDDVGVLLRVQNSALFAPGSATLTPKAESVLADVIDVLKTYNVFLIVRGHADTAEAKQGSFPSDWELSGARAAAAVRYLISKGGIEPARLRAVAYGDSRPLVPDLDPDAAAKNRRVEFYFHRPEVMNSQVLY